MQIIEIILNLRRYTYCFYLFSLNNSHLFLYTAFTIHNSYSSLLNFFSQILTLIL